MSTTKLIQFTLLISINNRKREFNFRQRTPVYYDANTTDESGERYYFRLRKETSQWVFENVHVMEWLKTYEPVVISAFEASEYLSQLE